MPKIIHITPVLKQPTNGMQLIYLVAVLKPSGYIVYNNQLVGKYSNKSKNNIYKQTDTKSKE